MNNLGFLQCKNAEMHVIWRALILQSRKYVQKTVNCEWFECPYYKYLTIIHQSGGKYPPLSPTLRWIIVLVYTTQTE